MEYLIELYAQHKSKGNMYIIASKSYDDEFAAGYWFKYYEEMAQNLVANHTLFRLYMVGHNDGEGDQRVAVVNRGVEIFYENGAAISLPIDEKDL